MSLLLFGLLNLAGVPAGKEDPLCTCDSDVRRCRCVGRQLDRVPQHLGSSVTHLIIDDSTLTAVRALDFEKYPQLVDIAIRNAGRLQSVQASAFEPLKRLKRLSINGCSSLRRVNGSFVLCNGRGCILTLNLANNGLEEVPGLTRAVTSGPIFRGATYIDLSGNKIRTVSQGEDSVGVDLIGLILSRNLISSVGGGILPGSRIHLLAFDHNPLVNVHPLAFARLVILKQLDLSFTQIADLPSQGLLRLEVITLRGVYTLKRLPTVFAFQDLRIARLTYAHHCCYFLNVRRTTTLGPRHCSKRRSKRYAVWGNFKVRNESVKEANGRTWHSRSDFKTTRPLLHRKLLVIPGAARPLGLCIPEELVDTLERVKCSPKPDALNPCEDMAGHLFVRLFMWLAWILAVIGNLGVVALFGWLCKCGRPTGVSGFLVSNLAFADLCMGVYLAMLAVQDVKTAGKYCNYAVDWQSGLGCSSAGFVAIFSSELSMFTIVAISIKLWYDTKESFYGFTFEWPTAVILQGIAWLLSILLAALPLANVNTYSATSVCLPIRTESVGDKAYLFTLLLLKLFAVGYVAFNYLHIYFMVSGVKLPAAHTQDWVMARKLTLLVCTNFVCWTPTIVLGLSAAVGRPLLDISTCKYFLVLAYPINATADPFLYAFSSSTVGQQVRLYVAAVRSNLIDHLHRVRHCSFKSAVSNATESTYSQVGVARKLISSFSSRSRRPD
uniref:G_PROTEIN_RECEP_F1_2 domain-containing protein n=1 Tax=Trichuris muris TaxID=70415 RepID=A0A5S6R5W9_TRIMR